MCVTTANAKLSDTIIGVWEIDHPQKGYRHVMAYQNVAQNLSDEVNCMVLHIPTSEAINPECFIDASIHPDFLKHMKERAVPRPRSFSKVPAQNYMLEMGVYHIAILNQLDTASLQKALDDFPKEKRPNISVEFLEFYREEYEGIPLVLCCFNTKDQAKTCPIMLHYAPLFPDYFMFPTLESHGSIPDFDVDVKYHQDIIAGTNIKVPGLVPFDFGNIDPQFSSFLPKYGIGEKLYREMPNGDVYVDIKRLKKWGQLSFHIN